MLEWQNLALTLNLAHHWLSDIGKIFLALGPSRPHHKMGTIGSQLRVKSYKEIMWMETLGNYKNLTSIGYLYLTFDSLKHSIYPFNKTCSTFK